MKVKEVFTILFFIFIGLFYIKNNVNALTDTIGFWLPTTNLNDQLASHTSVVSNNKLFLIGGATDVTSNKIFINSLDNGGNLTAWELNSLVFPESIYWHSSVSNNSFVYIIAGATYPQGIASSDVYMTNLNSGYINSWVQLNDIPEPLSLGNSIILNNRIYYIGGWRLGFTNNYSKEIYMAEINSVDGTLGTWTDIGDLPEELLGFGIAAAGNRITVFGGANAFQSFLSDDIYEITVNPATGLIDSVTNVGKLSRPIFRPGVTKIGNQVVSVGGTSYVDNDFENAVNEFIDEVYYSQIDDTGSLGPFILSSNHFPEKQCCGSLAASNTHLYYTGGYGNGYLDTVYYASVNNVDLTPTPEPGINLNVPYLNQGTLPWGPLVYDDATHWYPGDPTLKRWGCALTSAAMILNFYGHNILPDSLNDWLKSQKDGFTRSGGVMWTAISRYTKLSSGDGKPTLEFKYINPDDSILMQELEDSHPAIIKFEKGEGNHFIVAEGKTSTDFLINDPVYENFETLAQSKLKWGSWIKTGKFMPTNSDLSYIVLMVDEKNSIKLLDSDNNQIEGFNITEMPIIDPEEEISGLNNDVLNAIYYPQPNDEKYKVEISGSEGNYQIDAYLYDINGSVNVINAIGNLSDGELDSFIIPFSKSTMNQIYDNKFLEVIEYIQENSDSFHHGYKNYLIAKIINSNNHFLEGNKSVALKQIKVTIDSLDFYKFIRKNNANIYNDLKEVLINLENYINS